MKKYKIVKVKDFCNSRDYTQFYNARLPICTITSMVDVSRLVKFKNKHKFNAMMVYCVQMAGQKHDVCHYDFKDETLLNEASKFYMHDNEDKEDEEYKKLKDLLNELKSKLI